MLIVGAGGLGSPAALYLAAAGVGTLGIIDGDRVDLSNLQRQVLFDTAERRRTEGRARRANACCALNPEIDVRRARRGAARRQRARQFSTDYDIVLDGSDRLGTRYLVNDACVLLGKSLVSAAIHRFEGQAMTYVPGRGPCYRCLFSDAAEGVVPNCAEAGVLGVLPGVMGALQATEAIKLITGVGEPLLGRLLTYDALAMRFSEFRFRRRDDCAVCGAAADDHRCRASAGAVVRRGHAGLAAATAPTNCEPPSTQPAASALHPGRCAAMPHEFAAGISAGLTAHSARRSAATASGNCGTQRRGFVCLTGARSQRACALAAAAGLTTSGHLDWRPAGAGTRPDGFTILLARRSFHET